MFYYAVLNENNFVVELVTSETEISDSTYISITEDQYTNGDLLWLYYSQGQFIVCDNFIGSSDWIIYKNTDRPITPKFDEIDAQIAEKADSDHNHDGDYAALNHNHTASMIEETDGLKIMTAAERTKLSGIAENANNYTHPASHAQSEITGLEAALAGKASTSHTEHAGEIIANKTAGVGITLQSSYGKTRIHKNSNASSDYGTIISDYDIDGKRDYLQIRRAAPSTERKLFFISESTDGSIAQYKIYGEHNKPGILWSGVVYPGAESVVTLSKTISECRGGILLLWSDYDPNTSTANNNDFVTTIIPRMSPTGGNWNGESFYCEVPRYIGNDTTDVTTESRIIKRVKVYNNKIEGYIDNSRDVRSDVVLRAIYEM